MMEFTIVLWLLLTFGVLAPLEWWLLQQYLRSMIQWLSMTLLGSILYVIVMIISIDVLQQIEIGEMTLLILNGIVFGLLMGVLRGLVVKRFSKLLNNIIISIINGVLSSFISFNISAYILEFYPYGGYSKGYFFIELFILIMYISHSITSIILMILLLNKVKTK